MVPIFQAVDIKDQVMGGKSDGFMLLKESVNQDFEYISAEGNVSTDGGGFLLLLEQWCLNFAHS